MTFIVWYVAIGLLLTAVAIHGLRALRVDIDSNRGTFWAVCALVVIAWPYLAAMAVLDTFTRK